MTTAYEILELLPSGNHGMRKILESLISYAERDAECPCCNNTKCYEECTFEVDCPAEFKRMIAARKALGLSLEKIP